MLDSGDPGNFAQHILFHAYTRYGAKLTDEHQLAIADACGKLLACLSEAGLVELRLLLNACLHAAQERSSRGALGFEQPVRVTAKSC